ncbi:glutathione S-transferase [Agaricicola taiwanensis]|uniref:Glutathione S-transferase n=1 Tax=Agaricicola taiwanensis TaxID=591372 RepID=A0A8J2VN30_9RHOB|nr:glutathione S-transferase family protein [Agaricicola taiwanensis]GGE39604.1 glutathione S-transferase [Agaricicola taiwanensis]
MPEAQSEELVFYSAPQSRSIVIEWMLAELDVPFTRQTLDLSKGDQRKPDYLAVNPMGKVPSITHKGVAVSEVAAICTYLADAFPEKGLSVPIGDPQRGPYMKWLFFGPGALEPAISDKLFERPSVPDTASGYGTYDRVMHVLSDALSRQDYLADGRFTAADVVIGSTLGWGMMVKAVTPTPEIGAYLQRLQTRRAFQSVFGN